MLQARDLVRSLRLGARDANMTPAQACASLSSLFARHPESKQHFLSEGGVLAAMEMLDSDTTKILEPGGSGIGGRAWLGVCGVCVLGGGRCRGCWVIPGVDLLMLTCVCVCVRARARVHECSLPSWADP
jgi:hypothetical protein